MIVETIYQKFETLAEYLASPEYGRVWEGYTPGSKWNRVEFIAGYAVKANPETNYGKAFKLYIHYRLPGEGLKIMKEESTISICHSGGLYPVRIYEDTLCFQDRDGFKNIPAARKWIVDHDLTIWS